MKNQVFAIKAEVGDGFANGIGDDGFAVFGAEHKADLELRPPV